MFEDIVDATCVVAQFANGNSNKQDLKEQFTIVCKQDETY